MNGIVQDTVQDIVRECRAAYVAATGVPAEQVRVGAYRPGSYVIEGPAGVTTLEAAAACLDTLAAESVQVLGRPTLLRGWWSVLVRGARPDGTTVAVVVSDPDDVAALTRGVAGDCEACQAAAAAALVTVEDGRVRLCTTCLVAGRDLLASVRPTSAAFARAMGDVDLMDLVVPRTLRTLEAHLTSVPVPVGCVSSEVAS